MLPFAHTSCIILSAGNSNRMRKHKALLKYNENSTFLERITSVYAAAGIEQIIVVVNAGLYTRIKELKLNLPGKVTLVINEKPELGRFYSLQTGGRHLEPGNSCFFQNIDNPFTTEILLQELYKRIKEESDVIIPTFQGKSGHPVLFTALVAEKIPVETDPDLRIDEFLRKFNVQKTEMPEIRLLANINSPEDYTRAGFGV